MRIGYFYRESVNKWLLILLSTVLLLSLTLISVRPTSAASINTGYKTFVMGQLNLPQDETGWNNLRAQLVTLKNNGIAAITTDVWWGKFEPSNNNFVWNGASANYLRLAQTAKEVGIKWIPILSFHQCGGNVGDSCNIPIPSWLWTFGSADDMKFKSEQGNYSNEYLSYWFGGAYTQYEEAMQSFRNNFLTNYGSIIEKIYISMGPAGELRFPSYNSHDSGSGYPNRGYWQSFSTPAKNGFISYMQGLTGSNLSTLNSRWGTGLSSWSQVSPPTDGSNFWTSGAVNRQYGVDFRNWYQSVLLNHFDAMMTKAHTQLDAFGVRIGAKMAGVHWKGYEYGNNMAHSAEQPAGYNDYNAIVQKFKDKNADLTFTCLEMQNDYASPQYSYAKDLVIKVADIASSKGVSIFGENAISFSGDTSKYEQIAEHLFNRNFKGYTHLRLDTFVNSTGGATYDMSLLINRIALAPKAITFTVSGIPVGAGETVYLTGGNCSTCTGTALGWELGNWQAVTPYMVQMNSTGTAGQYRATVYLHNNRTYEFKAIKRSSGGAITWEGGGNNAANTAVTAAANWTW